MRDETRRFVFVAWKKKTGLRYSPAYQLKAREFSCLNSQGGASAPRMLRDRWIDEEDCTIIRMREMQIRKQSVCVIL
jgi:hypothetical protein